MRGFCSYRLSTEITERTEIVSCNVQDRNQGENRISTCSFMFGPILQDYIGPIVGSHPYQGFPTDITLTYGVTSTLVHLLWKVEQSRDLFAESCRQEASGHNE